MSDGGKKPEVLHPPWATDAPVRAGFTTRRGGLSTGRFAELNFSRRWPEDEPESRVDDNISLLAGQQGFRPGELIVEKLITCTLKPVIPGC